MSVYFSLIYKSNNFTCLITFKIIIIFLLSLHISCCNLYVIVDLLVVHLMLLLQNGT